jgi:hypothetical protein
MNIEKSKKKTNKKEKCIIRNQKYVRNKPGTCLEQVLPCECHVHNIARKRTGVGEQLIVKI